MANADPVYNNSVRKKRSIHLNKDAMFTGSFRPLLPALCPSLISKRLPLALRSPLLTPKPVTAGENAGRGQTP